MANSCYFMLHATAKSTKGLNVLIEAMSDESPADIIAGGIECSWCYGQGRHKTKANGLGEYYAYIDGDCRWSFQSAILDYKKFEKIVKKYHLNVEVYTSEPGIGFMEHYIWENGERILDECENAEMWNVEAMMDDEELLEEFLSSESVKQMGINRDNYEQFQDENGDIIIGGLTWDWTIN